MSLSDDAYRDLLSLKRPGESFSALARRLKRERKRDVLFDPTVRIDMTDGEAKRWIDEIYRERDRSLRPRYDV